MLKILSILLLLVGLKHVTCFPGFPGFMKILPGPYDEGGMKYEGIKDEGVPSMTFPPASPGLLSWMQCQPAFVAPTDGFVSCTNGNNIASICTFTCDEGYEMLGSDYSRCDYSYIERKLRWSSDAPLCVLEKNTCEPAWDAPVDGSIRCSNGNSVGSACRFACDEGYKMIGSHFSLCYNSNTGAEWTSNAPRCVKSTCEPAWDAPVDGSIRCSNGNSVGSTCRFACDAGYKMYGSPFTSCRYSYEGKLRWTSNAPLCVSGSWRNPPNGITYKLVKTSRRGNFKECQNLCAQQGGTLAQHSLALAYKDAMVAITGGEPTWIGVSNDNPQNEWRYTSIDGGHKPFPIKDTSSLVAKWADKQPGTDHQKCATIYKYKHDLVFSTLTCKPATSNLRYGICEYP